MDILSYSLSSLSSPALSSSLFGLNFKQFKRTYPGNFTLNFAFALSGYNDFGVNSYSNLYLTNKFKLSNVLELNEEEILKSTNVYTTIKYGDSFLYFNRKNDNYGTALFVPVSSFNTFFVNTYDDNRCNIYYKYNFKNYYLCADTNNELFFVKERYLNFSETTINPQDFYYVYSETGKEIYLFKNTLSGNFFLTKQNNKAILVPLVENNVISNISQPLKITKDFYFDPNQTLNNSFITYNDVNQINVNKSTFDLFNNFLLHKKYSDKYSKLDIILLKNQLSDSEVFGSSNNLLSSSQNKLYCDSLREYSSIFKDIKEEESNDLTLNYVFYNKSYKISPGLNTFISPSSMYPFKKLNINDSKFVDSGSFAYPTPEYADKIYKISNEPQNKKDGQYLLCTWLSGSPFSTEKVWVDRYYYPDLIEKEEAIGTRSFLLPTYDNYVESLINSNTDLKQNISKTKIFDKISDMAFEPNKEYVYERLTYSTTDPQSASYTYCNTVYPNINYPSAYYKTINKSSKITLSFFFDGDNTSWEVLSDRSRVNAGISITKNATSIIANYTIFDPATQNYRTFVVESPFITFKENFFCFSFDTTIGKGYFFLNNKILLTFTVAEYQYTGKNLIYGDVYIKIAEDKINLLENTQYVYKPTISDKYTPEDLAFVISIVRSNSKIDPLYITLPQGMRNGFDNIEYLQTICESSSFKSNNINIIIKNTNIDNQNVLNGIKESILNSIKGYLPSNSKINNITFSNYK